MYNCIQSIIHRAATRPIQFYCCYRDHSSDQSLYREALSGLFKSAMLETTDHRIAAFHTMRIRFRNKVCRPV